MDLTTLICILLAAATLIYITLPVLSPSLVHLEETRDRSPLLDEQERLVLILRELELDFHTQKMPEGEYNELRAPLEEQLARVLEGLEE